MMQVFFARYSVRFPARFKTIAANRYGCTGGRSM